MENFRHKARQWITQGGLKRFKRNSKGLALAVGRYFLPNGMVFLLCVALGALSLLLTPARWLFAPQMVLSGLWAAIMLQGLFHWAFKGRKSSLQKAFNPMKNWLWACWLLVYFQQPAFDLLQDYAQLRHVPQRLSAEFAIERQLKAVPNAMFVVRVMLPATKPFLAYVRWEVKVGEKMPKVGDFWQGKLQLRPVTARLNFGGFDRQKWFLSQKIIAEGRVRMATWIASRPNWRERILQNVRGETEHLSQQGMLLALAFGERAWLPYHTLALYQRTNTAHLIAISGLHIGLAMLLGMALMRAVQFFLPTRLISPLLSWLGGVFVATFYASLAGFAPPTFRALVAILLVSLLHFARITLNRWLILGLVLALLVLMSPLMVLSMSFWLSVSAVASLLLWYQCVPSIKWQQCLRLWHDWRKTPLAPKKRAVKPQWLQGLLKFVGGGVNIFLGLLHLQLGLFWLLTPIQLWMFNGSSWAALAANLLVVPVFSFVIIPLVLLATLLSMLSISLENFGTLAALLRNLSRALSKELWQGGNFLLENVNHALQPLASHWLAVSQWQALAISLGLWGSFGGVIFLRHYYATPQAQRSPKRMAVCGVLLVLLALGYAGWRYETRSRLSVTMLDVGQGLAVLLEKNGRALLYDTGVSWQFNQSQGSMAEREIFPYLQRQGLQLDGILLSHDDRDHAGGMTFFLQKFPHTLWRSASLKKYNGQRPKPCMVGEQWQWQGVAFTVLWPQYVGQRAKNEHSCVVLVQDKSHSLLLLGDATASVESAITPALQQYLKGKSLTLLQVAHHGSTTSTTPEFLQKFRPSLAWISASRWNMWGLPKNAVVQRLQAAGAHVANTGEQGALRFTFANGRFEQARSDYSAWYQGVLAPRNYTDKSYKAMK